MHKRFGDNEVLRGIDLDVDEHQVVCLIGPSGCGKSTLLRCINGLETIDGGEIALDGERVSGRGVDLNWLRQDVGIVFQSFNLFPHMTVLENVTLGAPQGAEAAEALRRGAGDGAARRGSAWTRRPTSTPTGCRAASSSASPSSGRWPWAPGCCCSTRSPRPSTPSWSSEVLDIVRELAAEGMTMLLATHEMGFAKEVASKVVFLYDGVVCEEGPPEQIFEDPARGADPSASSGASSRPAACSGTCCSAAVTFRHPPIHIASASITVPIRPSTPARERRDRPTCLQPHCDEQRGR